MIDYYLSEINCYKRLEEEFIKYGKLIIAVDYDDTIYDFHNKGRSYECVIELLRRWRPYAQIIIFTGNGEEKYQMIGEYCKLNDIPYDGINCDSLICVNGRKIYANAYLDDRGGLPLVYKNLSDLIDKIEKGEIKHV